MTLQDKTSFAQIRNIEQFYNRKIFQNFGKLVGFKFPS